MAFTLNSIRIHQQLFLPDGKYEGFWVGTQVHFTVNQIVYVGNTEEHRQSKVAVWVRVRGGCAKVEVKL